jgi:hypothetical protein
VTKNAAFKGICSQYKHKVDTLRYSYVTNLRYISFDGVAIESIVGDKFELVMDLIIRINLNELADKEDISPMQLRFFKLGIGQSIVKSIVEEKVNTLVDKSIK